MYIYVCVYIYIYIPYFKNEPLILYTIYIFFCLTYNEYLLCQNALCTPVFHHMQYFHKLILTAGY